ncbi:MAG: phospholipid carrier-dependent glycosyltransferase [Candidatus Aenigmarchaeota archaeon]|nr:phospholipid carrier-dependent glycosyltransferase [Candidatus Aenigmarchaeota archaeon]
MKPLHLLLVVLILAGLGARLYGLGDGLIWRDEGIAAIAGIKLHHENPYDARFFSSEHPPVGRWLIGLPTAWSDADFRDVLAIPPHLFAFTYLTPFKDVTVPMRTMVALGGILAVLFVFLIGKELFGTEAALWSAAIASLSLDYIAYSRILYTDMFALAFSAGTLYFYIKYLRAPASREWKSAADYVAANKKAIFFSLMIAFLVLALGSRLLYPLFLIPIIILSQLLVGKGWKQTASVIGAVVVALVLFLQVVYPPDLQAFAFQVHYGVGGYEGFVRLESNPVRFVEMLFLRNSYAYAFSLVAGMAAVFLLWRKHRKGSVRHLVRWLHTFDERPVMAVAFGVSFLIYLATRYGTVPSYTEFIHLPAFVLGGYAIARMSVPVKLVALVLLFVAVASIATIHPFYADYANFGQKDFVIQDFSGAYDPQYLVQDMLTNYLPTLQGPLLSNEQSILFKADAEPIPPEGFPDCTASFLDRFKDGYIIYRGSYTSSPTLENDQYLCQLLKTYPLELIRTFPTGDPEDPYPFLVYRVAP